MSTNKKVPKKFEKYSCESCDYITVRKSQYERHLLTRKHKLLNNTNKKVPKGSEQNAYHCSCGNTYKFASSLCYHKKTCKAIKEGDVSSSSDEKLVSPGGVVSNEMIMKLIEQNGKLQEQLVSLSKEKSVVNNIVIIQTISI